jgi:anti-anti-sigma regulatory factor
MSETALFLNLSDDCVMISLREAVGNLHSAQGEAIVDFSCVRRIDSCALHALEEFVRVADEKAIKTVLRGVNVDVYKVLKLANLTQRFSFVN